MAIAEVHSSAVDDEGDPSVVCASGQRSAVVLDPRAAPGNDGRPMEGISVLEPLEHSVLEVALDGRPMVGISVLEPLEHSVLEVALDRGDGSLVKVDVSDPLEHSGLDRVDDVVPGLAPPEPLEHSVLVIPLEEWDMSVTDVSMLDPIEQSGVDVRTEMTSAYLPRVVSVRKEVVHGIIGVKMFHSRTSCRSSDGPNRRRGGHCCGGRWFGGTLVSDGLGE